jgi:hypothetical protein
VLDELVEEQKAPLPAGRVAAKRRAEVLLSIDQLHRLGRGHDADLERLVAL